MRAINYSRRDLRMVLSLFEIALRDRFLGSTLGIFWAIANPLLMLGMFTFVFGYVFKAKLPGAETSLSYVIWLVSGYGPWLALTESLSTSTGSVVANRGLVKNLAFKHELLPIVGTLMGLVPLGVSLVFVLSLLAASGTAPSASWLVIPVILVLQLVIVAGLGLFLAGLNVFVRDTALVLPNILFLALFASPIFYPVTAFPQQVRSVVVWNPFYVLTEGYRLPLLEGRVPAAGSLVYLVVVALATFGFGLVFFRRLDPHFDARL
ncbi:MAG TPA: ABC transporter permease [Stellaceae bacterium]|nr:ABC transporter permease [Stellaceae bacterium]